MRFSGTPPIVRVALTFDDGPMPYFGGEDDTTSRVSEILRANDGRATFFVEHSRINSKIGREHLSAFAKDGHEVAIHGASPLKHHESYAITEDREQGNLLDNFTSMKEIIKGSTGRYPTLARPPGGELGLKTDIQSHFVESPFKQGPRELSPILTLSSIEDALIAAELTDFLGEGTTGENSWVGHFGSDGFDPLSGTGPAITPIADKIDAARLDGRNQQAVILLHDVAGQEERNFLVDNLQRYIDSIGNLAESSDVFVKYVTMSELVGVPDCNPGFCNSR